MLRRCPAAHVAEVQGVLVGARALRAALADLYLVICRLADFNRLICRSQPRHRAPWLKRGDVAAIEPLKAGSNAKAGGPAGSGQYPSNKPVSGGSTGSDRHPSDKLAQNR